MSKTKCLKAELERAITDEQGHSRTQRVYTRGGGAAEASGLCVRRAGAPRRVRGAGQDTEAGMLRQPRVGRNRGRLRRPRGPSGPGPAQRGGKGPGGGGAGRTHAQPSELGPRGRVRVGGSPEVQVGGKGHVCACVLCAHGHTSRMRTRASFRPPAPRPPAKCDPSPWLFAALDVVITLLVLTVPPGPAKKLSRTKFIFSGVCTRPAALL